MPWALMLFVVNPVRAPRVGPAPHMGRGSPVRCCCQSEPRVSHRDSDRTDIMEMREMPGCAPGLEPEPARRARCSPGSPPPRIPGRAGD